MSEYIEEWEKKGFIRDTVHSVGELCSIGRKRYSELFYVLEGFGMITHNMHFKLECVVMGEEYEQV